VISVETGRVYYNSDVLEAVGEALELVLRP